MGFVLGVSVGTSAIRMARPEADARANNPDARSFAHQTVVVTHSPSDELAAEAIGVALASGEQVDATGIAFGASQSPEAIDAALSRQHLQNYQLVPDAAAVVECVDSMGELAPFTTVAVYDLGASGLTVSVVDVHSRRIAHTERSTQIGGDHFDSLIREQQVASGRLNVPRSQQDVLDQNERCRGVKEQLSTTTGAALSGDNGLVLLSREHFDSLIVLAVEASARLAPDVIAETERPVEAIVVVGGGARIPLVQNVLRKWMGMPVLLPDGPETVAARGAALIASQARPAPQVAPPPVQQNNTPAWLTATTGPREVVAPSRKREISGAGLAVTSLAVIAAIGLALGYGGQMLERDTGSSGSSTTQPKPPSRTTTSDPSIAVAPILPSSTPGAPAPAAPAPRTTDQQRTQNETDDAAPAPAPGPPPPAPVVIPGLPPIVIPTLPPPPPPPQLPRIELPPLPRFP